MKRFLIFLLGTLVAAASSAQTSSNGSIAGSVGNSGTKQYLQGATVTIAALHRQILTNTDGSFTISDLAPGDYSLKVEYIGLDPETRTVHVDAGQTTTLNIQLTAAIYKLETFQVTGVREGLAEAITEQRNAPNVEKVQALDALGNLPNDSPGEMLVRMPGISGNLDAENNVQGIQVRGLPDGLVSFYIDGFEEAGPGGSGRVFATHSISAALFDSIAVVPAPTPDMSADSIAGSILFAMRDPLAIEGNYEASYRISDRVQGLIDGETPTGKKHDQHPLFNAAFDQVYDVFGGKRNLGISFSAFYSENATAYWENGNNMYETPLLPGPAYMDQYQTIDGYNNRKQTSFDLRAVYKASDHTNITFNALYNDAFEPYNPIYTATAATTNAVATVVNGVPTGSNGILPGYTNDVTQVLPVAGSKMTLNSSEYGFMDRQRQAELFVKNDWDRLHLNYGINYNYAHAILNNGKANGNDTGGTLTYSLPDIGWIVDQTKSAIYPAWTQDAGPSVTNGANYGSGLFTTRNNHRDTDKASGKFDATYDLPTTFTSSVQAGYLFERTTFRNEANAYEYNYTGSAPLSSLVDPNLLTYDEARTGLMLPWIKASTVATQVVDNPSAWTQNLYYHSSQDYIGTNTVVETINATYAEAKATWGPVDFMTGVRMEHTGEYGFGYVPAKTLSTSAQQAANPIGSADADYDNPRVISGGYTNVFPGVFATYHLLKNVQVRADYTESIGRPTAADIVPTQTFSTTANTLTIANPSLRPELSKNLDFDLEYYFEPVGKLTAGWFHKNISDYIASESEGFVATGEDNGYQGNYQGAQILTNVNTGDAVVDGWEFEWQQRLDIIPGLGMFANYTQIQTHGNYGSSTQEGANQLASFVPKTGNVGLNYQYRRFTARLLVNYTGRWLNTSSTNAALELYRYARTIANCGVGYEFTRALTFSVDITNLFNEPQGEYYAVPTRRSLTVTDYPNVVFGLSGKF